MSQLLTAKIDSKLDNTSFLSKYDTKIKNVDIGCSFAPELWSEEEIVQGKPLIALNIIINQLNIKKIRLGLRWDKIDDGNGQYRLDYYKPYLDYCFSNKIDVCLNVGPIKTFRWPEEHVPQNVLKSITKIPGKGKSIILSSEMGIQASEYLISLSDLLRTVYGVYELNMIKYLQVENEPFYKFGQYRWNVSYLYLYHLISNISRKFPNAGIMLNSAGRLNLRNILKMYKFLNDKQLNTYPQLLVGYDYYYKFPILNKIPLINLLDNIVLSYPWNMSCKELMAISKELKLNVEVSEAQMEPWGNIKTPGNSVAEFKFMLLRCMQNFQYEDSKLLIRIWGIEELTKKIIAQTYSNDHIDIIELITSINKVV